MNVSTDNLHEWSSAAAREAADDGGTVRALHDLRAAVYVCAEAIVERLDAILAGQSSPLDFGS